VIEIRGGTALYEYGAVGGLYLGVVFLDDQDNAAVRPVLPKRPAVVDQVPTQGGTTYNSKADAEESLAATRS
jgi:hypothetical protein